MASRAPARDDDGLLRDRDRPQSCSCIVDVEDTSAGQGEAYSSLDGTLQYPWEVSRTPHEPFDGYERDLIDFESPYYKSWRRLGQGRLKQLDQTLQLAKDQGIRVVGFIPSFPTRYSERLKTGPTAEPMMAFLERMPEMFERHGYPFIDLHEIADVPCADDVFVDNVHVGDGCARRIRGVLDRLAEDRWG